MSTPPKELERNENIFAVVVLAAKRMLDAAGDPKKRGKFSLELLNLLRERGYDNKRMKSIQWFIYRILRIQDEEIEPKVKEVWKMHSIPISEAVEQININIAREEGLEEGREIGKEIGIEMGIEKGMDKLAETLLAMGMSPNAIEKARKMLN